MPVYDSSRKGGYGGTTELAQRAISLNVIGFNNLITNTNQRNRFLGNVWGEFEILKGLKYKINVSADKLIWNDRYYNPPSNLGWYYVTENAEARMSLNNGNVTRTILNNTLTYETTIADKHKIDVLVGMLDERSDLHRVITNSQGFEDG